MYKLHTYVRMHAYYVEQDEPRAVPAFRVGRCGVTVIRPVCVEQLLIILRSRRSISRRPWTSLDHSMNPQSPQDPICRRPGYYRRSLPGRWYPKFHPPLVWRSSAIRRSCCQQCPKLKLELRNYRVPNRITTTVDVSWAPPGQLTVRRLECSLCNRAPDSHVREENKILAYRTGTRMFFDR